MLSKHHVRSFFFFSFVALSACKHESDIVPKAQALIDRIYACTDLPCALAVEDEFHQLTSDAHDLAPDESDFVFQSAAHRISTQIGALEIDTAQGLVRQANACKTVSCVNVIETRLRELTAHSHVTDRDQQDLLSKLPAIAQHRLAAIDKHELVSRLRAIKDRLCACTDTACVGEALAESKLVARDEEAGEAGEAIARERFVCMKAIAERASR